MTPADYVYLCGVLKQQSGLMLTNDKQYLVESRLLPLAGTLGLGGVVDLIQKIKAGDKVVLSHVVEAMTTNETFFFRDKTPFEALQNGVMPELLNNRTGRPTLRIWCAAASTGQEPYSIAMIMKDLELRLGGRRVEIVATDVSNEVLTKSKAGCYSHFEVQRGLPIKMLMQHFKQKGEVWQINDDIRSMVQFRQLNLLHDFSHLGVFDVIFCRNVLIYFDQPRKTEILGRLAKSLAPDGYLALGAAETVIGLTNEFRSDPACRGFYRPTAVRDVQNAPSIVPAMQPARTTTSVKDKIALQA